MHLRVRDNGPGVPDDLRDAVFVRGFSTKPDVLGGRGIGLPLVRLICAQRGGRVEVDRAAGRAAPSSVVLAVPARRSGTGMVASMIRVLVVDDDFMVARIHPASSSRPRASRSRAPPTPAPTRSALVAELAPDLLLLDVHLPDLSRARRARPAARATGSQVAVVMVTAERGAEAVRAALHGGAMQYLVKPFEYADLADRLRAVAASLTPSPGRSDRTRADGRDQATIDQAFGTGRPRRLRAGRLPKGLSPETADLVLAALAGAPTRCRRRRPRDAVGLSRVTARRYLEHFVETGQPRCGSSTAPPAGPSGATAPPERCRVSPSAGSSGRRGPPGRARARRAGSRRPSRGRLVDGVVRRLR